MSKQITLDASGSKGPSGQTLSYNWAVSPDSSRVPAIIHANTTTPAAQFKSGYGSHTFTVTVTTSSGSTARESKTILYVCR